MPHRRPYLLPALLAVLGNGINAVALPVRLRPANVRAAGSAADGWWARWARFVTRRPVWLGLPTLILLGALMVPLFSLRLGFDLGLGALGGTPSGRGEQILATSFAPGTGGPIQIIGCSPRASLDTPDRRGVTHLLASLRADRRVASVSPARNPGGPCFYANVFSAVPIDSTGAGNLVTDIRQHLAPAAFAGTAMRVEVGGLTAQYVDLSKETRSKFPLVIAIVLGLSFCYLLIVFRSLLLPVKAVVLNLLSPAAALGLTVFIFQQGHGAHVLGFTSVGTLQGYLPVAMFALLFGLSMDYELFLVRRIQEEWLSGKSNGDAIVIAVQNTGRQITAGATIMVAVFGSFLVAGVLELKQFGFALAAAVLIDATLIRMLLVPAAMALGGGANWWLPGPLGLRARRAVTGSRSLPPTHARQGDARHLRASTAGDRPGIPAASEAEQRWMTPAGPGPADTASQPHHPGRGTAHPMAGLTGPDRDPAVPMIHLTGPDRDQIILMTRLTGGRDPAARRAGPRDRDRDQTSPMTRLTGPDRDQTILMTRLTGGRDPAARRAGPRDRDRDQTSPMAAPVAGPDGRAREPAGTARRSAGAASPDAPGGAPLHIDPAQVRNKLQEIQSAFVDNPRESVTRAADLADNVVNALVATAKEQKHAMRDAWDDGEADTERLRNALQRYRALIDRLCGEWAGHHPDLVGQWPPRPDRQSRQAAQVREPVSSGNVRGASTRDS